MSLVDRLEKAAGSRPDLLFFILLIGILNAPVLVGSWSPSLIFQPNAVRHGEWWRVLTHPFVHVTWYHLLLDATAFLALYHSLLEPALLRRLACVTAAAAGSLLFCCVAPTSAKGLCGLSAVAHGLMAISALELIGQHPAGSAERRIGLATFLFVVAKAGFEALSGRMLFSFLDFGLLGSPVPVSHAGGIMGGLAAMLLMGRGSSRLAGRVAMQRRLESGENSSHPDRANSAYEGPLSPLSAGSTHSRHGG